jgi:hypothetical protein
MANTAHRSNLPPMCWLPWRPCNTCCIPSSYTYCCLPAAPTAFVAICLPACLPVPIDAPAACSLLPSAFSWLLPCRAQQQQQQPQQQQEHWYLLLTTATTASATNHLYRYLRVRQRHEHDPDVGWPACRTPTRNTTTTDAAGSLGSASYISVWGLAAAC